MRYVLLALVLLAGCTQAPAPVAPAATPAPPRPEAAPESGQRVLRRVLAVTASGVNVRKEPSLAAEVITQLAKGAEVAILGNTDAWFEVRLGDGRIGWVARRFLSEEKAEEPARTAAHPKKQTRCESDYTFVQTPALSFSEEDAHGLVVVEANVNAQGIVTSTKVVTNNTGNPDAGARAEREIRSAKFAPPMRNCVPRPFVFTYRRTF